MKTFKLLNLFDNSGVTDFLKDDLAPFAKYDLEIHQKHF